MAVEKAPLCVSLSEAQAYARVHTGEEEALLVGLLRVASELCESFLNQVLLTRSFTQVLEIRGGTAAVSIAPVQSITEVRLAGSQIVLAADAFATDISSSGCAIISGLADGQRVEVSGTAGLGSDPNDIPEPVRQGILRLAASMFANRDAAVGTLPAAVTALWRPYRRSGLSA